MNQNTRKNRLRLMSGLYDIAARFTEAELVELSQDPEGDMYSRGFAKLALAMNSTQSDLVQKSSHSELRPQREPSAHSAKRREAVLREILMSKELFKNAAEVEKVVPRAPSIRVKESRAKYINRVLAGFRELSPEEQRRFTQDLQRRITTGAPPNFVSRWSKLIRDL